MICSDKKINKQTPCGCKEDFIFNGGITILDYISTGKVSIDMNYEKIHIKHSYNNETEYFADVIDIKGRKFTAKVIDSNLFKGSKFNFYL